MKILHCCLMGAFTEKLAYQENIMSLMHKLQGHDVLILASTETFINNTTIGYTSPIEYITKEGIRLIRVPFKKWLPKQIEKKIRIYNCIYHIIEDYNPDIIFMHDCQFFNIFEFSKYLKKNNNVRLYIDSHTDQYNSAKNILSKYILHRLIYRRLVKSIIPFTTKFYGTLPARGDFYKKFYRTPLSKTEFLPMGINPIEVDFQNRNKIKNEIRQNLNIKNHEFVFITGGKINIRKNIHLLMKAINRIKSNDIKLIIFGSPTNDTHEIFHNELNESNNKIIHLGWIPSNETYKYFFASDMAFFPGTHSTLWEEALGLGIPCIFKYWEGINHVDLSGNCILLEEPNIDSISNIIMRMINNKFEFEKMKINALKTTNMEMFNYYNISKKAIEID